MASDEYYSCPSVLAASCATALPGACLCCHEWLRQIPVAVGPTDCESRIAGHLAVALCWQRRVCAAQHPAACGECPSGSFALRGQAFKRRPWQFSVDLGPTDSEVCPAGHLALALCWRRQVCVAQHPAACGVCSSGSSALRGQAITLVPIADERTFTHFAYFSLPRVLSEALLADQQLPLGCRRFVNPSLQPHSPVPG